MTAPIDRTGHKYNHLEVLARAECPVKHACDTYRKSGWWSCRCDCGNVVVRNGNAIASGATKSCGCLVKRVAQAQQRTGKPHAKRPNRPARDMSALYAWRGYSDVEVIGLIDEGKSIGEITDWLGCEAYKIHKIARKFGRKVAASPRRLTPEEVEQIRLGVQAGETIQAISKKISRCKVTVLECSWKFRPKGSRHAVQVAA